MRANLDRRTEAIASRNDLAEFVRELASALKTDPQSWENTDLEAFLKALAAWAEDMDGYYQNVLGRQVPDQPTWRTLGEILAGART
jgi:hypothetical protein